MLVTTPKKGVSITVKAGCKLKLGSLSPSSRSSLDATLLHLGLDVTPSADGLGARGTPDPWHLREGTRATKLKHSGVAELRLEHELNRRVLGHSARGKGGARTERQLQGTRDDEVVDGSVGSSRRVGRRGRCNNQSAMGEHAKKTGGGKGSGRDLPVSSQNKRLTQHTKRPRQVDVEVGVSLCLVRARVRVDRHKHDRPTSIEAPTGKNKTSLELLGKTRRPRYGFDPKRRVVGNSDSSRKAPQLGGVTGLGNQPVSCGRCLGDHVGHSLDGARELLKAGNKACTALGQQPTTRSPRSNIGSGDGNRLGSVVMARTTNSTTSPSTYSTARGVRLGAARDASPTDACQGASPTDAS
jgi:hypothetical protein